MKLLEQSRKQLKLIVCLTLLGTSACATSTTETVRTVSNYCLLTQPITFSATVLSKETEENKYDTEETIGQVKKHNSRFECVCNNDCPVQPQN